MENGPVREVATSTTRIEGAKPRPLLPAVYTAAQFVAWAARPLPWVLQNFVRAAHAT